MLFVSCTNNQRVKQFGGTATLDLPKNERLVNTTWKDDNLWILTEKVERLETPKTYYFTEKSSFGVMNGTYILIEHN
jgi:hypothetical protein